MLLDFFFENKRIIRKKHYLCIQKENGGEMKAKKTKEEALSFIKAAIQHKQEWKKELEAEFQGKNVSVVFL